MPCESPVTSSVVFPPGVQVYVKGATPPVTVRSIDPSFAPLQVILLVETLVPNELCLAAIAKGVGRKPSLDQVYGYRNNRMSILQVNRTSLHLIQEIRDEAHRFAIAGHRRRRSKVRTESPLQQISGVGSKRRQALLRYFGGLRAIERASIDELSRVSGISIHLANRIYQHFHY